MGFAAWQPTNNTPSVSLSVGETPQALSNLGQPIAIVMELRASTRMKSRKEILVRSKLQLGKSD